MRDAGRTIRALEGAVSRYASHVCSHGRWRPGFARQKSPRKARRTRIERTWRVRHAESAGGLRRAEGQWRRAVCKCAPGHVRGRDAEVRGRLLSAAGTHEHAAAARSLQSPIARRGPPAAAICRNARAETPWVTPALGESHARGWRLSLLPLPAANKMGSSRPHSLPSRLGRRDLFRAQMTRQVATACSQRGPAAFAAGASPRELRAGCDSS